MEKTVKKKLTPSRERLLALQGDRLSKVLGGTTPNTGTRSGTCIDTSRCNCRKDICPPPP
jgi:hypothetical protein